MRRARHIRRFHAFHAGLAAFIAATLMVVLFLAPIFAGETNFPGHQHPEGTPDHIHTLEQAAVALSVFEALVVLIFTAPAVVYTLLHTRENPLTRVDFGLPLARAPPIFC